MPWQLAPFAETGLTPALLDALLADHESSMRPALSRLWAYYRNPSSRPAGAPGPSARSLAQASGLPARFRRTAEEAPEREVVIENDIAWRIDAMVDFLFGRPVRIRSLAPDPRRREIIERAVNAAWEASGGLALLQDAALLSAVYGAADLVLRDDGPADGPTGEEDHPAVRRAARVRIELVEAPRAIPLIDPADYRRVAAFIIRAPVLSLRAREPSFLQRLLPGAGGAPERHASDTVEILSGAHRQVYTDGRLVLSEPHRFGALPLVHIQNTSQPYRYLGVSDVEPLIHLQDELNTRLSDRAYRVTLQSFKMFLARSVERAPDHDHALRIAPGQVWFTENPDASIEAFGGDAHSPSEESHIRELREAMDKASAVSPVVIGVIRERLGHLSSENALRVTLSGILARTERKRILFERGIARACALVLELLQREGALDTAAHERAVRIDWPDPLPVDARTKLAQERFRASQPRNTDADAAGAAPIDPLTTTTTTE